MAAIAEPGSVTENLNYLCELFNYLIALIVLKTFTPLYKYRFRFKYCIKKKSENTTNLSFFNLIK